MIAETAASKVTADHLSKTALLYVRQSTVKQVLHNTESAHRQYDLRGRATALGWAADQIKIIDIDQGRSGASAADREGFQELVAEVSLGKAGIVLGLECSRLARNNADWHQLLELCAMTGTLICDEDGLYDPRGFNDRLLLGMKGQMSEAELHFIKARLRGGVLSKARRGELITPLPVGLVYDAAEHVVLDPDTSVQQALRLLFDTFTATGSATACVKAFTAAHLSFPWRHLKGPHKGELDWKPLRHHTVLRVLHNPRYAGAFSYGRRRHQQLPGGKISTKLLPREEWTAFIPHAHPGYIGLDQYETNLGQLAANAAARGHDRAAGPPREGHALLQGIVICGSCGQRMTVRYHHPRTGAPMPTYLCQRDGIETGSTICASIAGAGLDAHIGGLLLQSLTPLTIEAAFCVCAELEAKATDADRLRASHVERARHRADQARRRYLAVDPGNRLVAETLEADWNTALRELAQAQDAYHAAAAEHAGKLTDAQRERINQLVTDLPGIWNDPATPARERKRIVRLLITDVTLVKNTEHITVGIRWRGGQEQALTLPLPKPATELRKTDPATVAAIDELLADHTINQITDILNDRCLTTGVGNSFDRIAVDRICRAYQLRSRYQRLRDEAGMLTLDEITERLGVAPSTIKTWCRAGLVGGLRYNDKHQMLYYAPDPNTRAHRGVRLASRRPTQTQQTTRTSPGGAV